MRAFFFISAAYVALPTGVSAHVGHLTGLAGHDHLVAGAAIGTAIAIGVIAAIKSRGKQSTPDTSDADEPCAEAEPQEAQA